MADNPRSSVQGPRDNVQMTFACCVKVAIQADTGCSTRLRSVKIELRDRTRRKESPQNTNSPKCFHFRELSLVAGAGFEPATFGL